MDQRRLLWAADASFVVDQLKIQNDPVVGELDLNSLGMLGHSFGGQAASIVCASDVRFKACANLDGQAQGNTFLPDAAGRLIKQPFLFFTKAAEVTDAELAMMNISREEYRSRESRRLRERFKPSYKTRLASIPSGAYLVTYPGARHSSFGDSLFLDMSNGQTSAERLAMADVIRRYTRAFFEKYLEGEDSPELQPARSGAPVIVEFLKK
jgi:dienelactone hydrolase